MPAEGTQSDGLTFETTLRAACKELNAKLKANPGCKPNMAAAARRHSLNYSTLRNRFQGLASRRQWETPQQYYSSATQCPGTLPRHQLAKTGHS